MRTTRFLNNIHQVCSRSNGWRCKFLKR